VVKHTTRPGHYGSYRPPRALLWNIGVIIYVLMMASAFLGYQHLALYEASLPGNFTTPFLLLPSFKYVKSYSNLHSKETQSSILNDNRGKTGVYCVFNMVTGSFYVGSAVTNRLNTRFRNHCIHTNSSTNKHLRSAIIKYGIENFLFLILE